MKKETTLPDELARLLLLETDEDVKTEDDSPSLDYRRDIRSILTALYERAPYIYALFKAAPKTEFRIALTEDFSRGDLPDETYTIPEFCARYASFKPKGQIFLISFSVYCSEKEREETYRKHGEVFCSPEGTALCEIDSEDLDMAVEEIVSEFPNYMMCRCRAAILANEPLRIDDETIARYALTAEDAARLRRIVKRCNTEIVAELRGQYERLAAIDGLRIYGTAPGKCAILSFNVEGVHPYDMGMILDKLGIAVRTGQHCAEPVMDHYGTTGMCRASFALYNTLAEADALAAGVERAVRMLRN